MDGFFDGLGTELVMLVIGLLVGGGAGSAVTWRITTKKQLVRQSQKAGNDATQNQVGHDYLQERGK
ncbi:hypothetical protein [Arthrobacter humicola]|jgi:hypothetical protein|uniref:hypothetical protein n=1 Tax=Arthrobacter humicola TaxID=409291 RepID=UPI001FABBBE1|nr:hypothetical protein [Arthrobacter humicola]